MKHRTTSGKILHLSHANGVTRELGREWYSLTEHEGGQRTLRARCEIEAGVVAPDVLREVTYSTDANFRPIDCYNRLHANGQFLGAGWMRFTETEVECESWGTALGRVSQTVKLKRRLGR